MIRLPGATLACSTIANLQKWLFLMFNSVKMWMNLRLCLSGYVLIDEALCLFVIPICLCRVNKRLF